VFATTASRASDVFLLINLCLRELLESSFCMFSVLDVTTVSLDCECAQLPDHTYKLYCYCSFDVGTVGLYCVALSQSG
jgi:hypothetical protein